MERDVCSHASKVPHHLRPFQRPSLVVEPVLTADDTPTLKPTPARTVEVCPPHWRPPPKRSLRHTLKDILLKEWPRPTPRTSPQSSSTDRPGMMRMKDSDDYITARAANPRTGLISPSVGTLTPRPADTPDSPGEALNIGKKEILLSPTPSSKARPGLKRANEGRKLRSNVNSLWKTDEHGWLMDVGLTAVSPRVTATEVEGDLVSSDSQPLPNEDALIVRMPSAQEPQPYAYPGYSAKQIQAAEFYKRKSRKVSSDGYDKRLIQGKRQASSETRLGLYGVGKVSSSKSGQNLPCRKVLSTDSPVFHGGHITVAKRRLGPQDCYHPGAMDCRAGAELHASIFAPFSSPKTPATQIQDGMAMEMHTTQVPRHEQAEENHHIYRKPHEDSGKAPSPSIHDLKDLPHVALVHPTLAALPQTHPQRQRMQQDGPRACSFGCERNVDGVTCTERRTHPANTRSFSNHSLFDQQTVDLDIDSILPQNNTHGRRFHPQEGSQILEHLATAVISITDTCRRMSVLAMPRVRVLDILRADNKTPQQKLDVLRQLFSTTGLAILLLAISAILWHVGTALKHAFENVLWPVVLPFRILRWLGSGH